MNENFKIFQRARKIFSDFAVVTNFVENSILHNISPRKTRSEVIFFKNRYNGLIKKLSRKVLSK
jgi:hypothetical protein